MNEKVLKRKVDIDNFYPVYLKTLNGHLALTNRELEVLVELCTIKAKYLDQKLTENELAKLVLGKAAREELRSKLNISPFNLNNIIKSLKDKQVLLANGRKYTINPRLFVPPTDKEYSINFKIEIV